jgi:hypothetical protein
LRLAQAVERLGELEPARAAGDLPGASTAEFAPREVTIVLTLTAADVEALARECREIDLTPKQWIISLVRARLHGTAQFGRSDRVRIGRCLEVLRGIEEQVARAVRALRTQGLPQESAALRMADLTSFAFYVARVRDTLHDAVGANRGYWRGRPSRPDSWAAPGDQR